ncbi:NUDIX domain-containing protein [Thalassospira alkalitolerans]|uniref:DNA mismatch repair protein MutT n=1 Tax=Thalassospira alkalitolerans TaxID=1293890 RepID=A0A1Y2LCQ4_9PROT|nr:NUDIX domain-containing protein [Thalassospira alkalitolerans]OSQ48636.1 DNA mismatch repair protein MutT [Thalassospira alkalitolerans]
MVGPIFGNPDMGRSYAVQDCVYAVILNDAGEVAVARTPKGIVLIGGGVERGESERDALHREAYEESGYRIEIRSRLGFASQYVNNFSKGRFRLKRGVFFLCDFGECLGPPLELDHELIWLPYEDAHQKLIRPFHRWALEVGQPFRSQY